MATTMLQQQDLPSELVLDILELGAAQDRPTAIALLRLASWSHMLLLPSLYRTVSLQSWSRVDQFKHTLALSTPLIIPPSPKLGRKSKTVKKSSSPPPSHSALIRSSITRLSVSVGEYPISDILSACSSLSSLVVSSNLFKGDLCPPYTNFMPSHLIYSPANLSPSLTHLSITGPAYLVQPHTLPKTVSHVVFTEDAPIAPGAIKAIGELAHLTHIAFRFNGIGQMGGGGAVPGGPDPSERVNELLGALFAKGIPNDSEGNIVVPGTDVNEEAELIPPVSLIAIMLSANVDPRIVETLANYRRLLTATPSPTRFVVFKEGEGTAWWNQTEWSFDNGKGDTGDKKFWTRMENAKSIFDSQSSEAN